MSLEPFVYLSSTPSKRSAEMLCAWIEDLGVPVLMAHEQDSTSARFSVYVPKSELEKIKRNQEGDFSRSGGVRFSQAFGL